LAAAQSGTKAEIAGFLASSTPDLSALTKPKVLLLMERSVVCDR
jgi:hypothetical protein